MVARSIVISIMLALICLFPYNPVNAYDSKISWMDTDFVFEFSNGTYLNFRIKVDVHNLTVFGRIYGADELRELPVGAGAASAAIYEYLSDILEKVFHGCKVNLDIPNPDSSTLNIPKDSDIYNPPITFYTGGNVSINNAFFGSDFINVHDLVDGLLDVGAKIRYDFGFVAPPFWNVTYIFRLPTYISIKEVYRGITSIDGREVKWEINNWKNRNEGVKEGYVILREVSPSYYVDREIIDTNITFDLSKIDSAYIDSCLNIRSLYVSDIVSFPSFIEGVEILPSDGVRLLLMNGLIHMDKLQELTRNKWSYLIEDLNKALGKNLTFSMYMDNNTTINCPLPYNTSHMDTDPPIIIKGLAQIEKLFDNLSTRAVIGTVYSGGKVSINRDLIDLDRLRYPFEAKMVLPYGSNYTWNSSRKLNVTLSYDMAPKYTTERKERIVEINVKDINLDLLDMLSGKGNVVDSIDIRDNLLIYRIRSSNLLSLPSWIEMDIMDSDLFRLFVEEGILDIELRHFIDERLNISKDLLKLVAKQGELKVYLDEMRFKSSLEWDKNIRNMDDQKPINISFFSITNRKSKFSFSLFPFSLTIVNESFDCFSTPGENITYIIVFPKGAELYFNDSLSRSRRIVLDDGRECIEVSFSSNDGLTSTTVYYSLKLSPLITLLVFLPIFVMIIIIIIIVGIIIITLRRRRLRPKAPERIEISDEQTSDLGQKRDQGRDLLHKWEDQS